MTALHCLKHIIKSRPRCFLTCCTHWTELKMRSLVRNQASVPEIFEQHEGFKLQEGRETQHLCGVMSYYRLKEREKRGAVAASDLFGLIIYADECEN